MSLPQIVVGGDIMPNASIIANRLKQMRISKGVSSDQMAKDLNISRSAINMYETGYRIPRDEIKVKIANYFNKTVDAIFFTD